jgi:hypothetical protein
MTAKKQAPSIMSRMGDSVKHTASSMMLKTRDKEFTDIAEFAKTFNEKISSVEKVTDKLARERFGMFNIIFCARQKLHCIVSICSLRAAN